MSMIAAGKYLRTLREKQQLTRADVAQATGTSESQIVRIEGGEQDSRVSLVLSIVHVVRGSADQLMKLLLDDDATLADGQQLAEVWLNHVAEYKDRDVLSVIREMRTELDQLEERVDRRQNVGGVEPAT